MRQPTLDDTADRIAELLFDADWYDFVYEQFEPFDAKTTANRDCEGKEGVGGTEGAVQSVGEVRYRQNWKDVRTAVKILQNWGIADLMCCAIKS